MRLVLLDAQLLRLNGVLNEVNNLLSDDSLLLNSQDDPVVHLLVDLIGILLDLLKDDESPGVDEGQSIGEDGKLILEHLALLLRKDMANGAILVDEFISLRHEVTKHLLKSWTRALLTIVWSHASFEELSSGNLSIQFDWRLGLHEHLVDGGQFLDLHLHQSSHVLYDVFHLTEGPAGAGVYFDFLESLVLSGISNVPQVVGQPFESGHQFFLCLVVCPQIRILHTEVVERVDELIDLLLTLSRPFQELDELALAVV